MADEVDLANDRILADLEARIAAARAPKERGPEECEDCEAPMPELRRGMGLRVCVECAEISERRRRVGLR